MPLGGQLPSPQAAPPWRSRGDSSALPDSQLTAPAPRSLILPGRGIAKPVVGLKREPDARAAHAAAPATPLTSVVDCAARARAAAAPPLPGPQHLPKCLSRRDATFPVYSKNPFLPPPTGHAPHLHPHRQRRPQPPPILVAVVILTLESPQPPSSSAPASSPSLFHHGGRSCRYAMPCQTPSTRGLAPRIHEHELPFVRNRSEGFRIRPSCRASSTIAPSWRA